MNEWAFAAEIKSWWDSEFPAHPDWRMARCEVERRVIGALERSDLTGIELETGLHLAVIRLSFEEHRE
jgi:hypothetical protein